MFLETVSAAAPVRLTAEAFETVLEDTNESIVAGGSGGVLGECHRMHRHLESLAPEWFDELARRDLLLCDVEELDALLGSAPGDFMGGYVFSWFSSRAAIVMMAQRYVPSGPQGPARRAAIEQIKRESKAHDDWFAGLDQVDPDTCDKDEILVLLSTAPSPFMRGYLYGKVMMRIELAAVTGRTF